MGQLLYAGSPFAVITLGVPCYHGLAKLFGITFDDLLEMSSNTDAVLRYCRVHRHHCRRFAVLHLLSDWISILDTGFVELIWVCRGELTPVPFTHTCL